MGFLLGQELMQMARELSALSRELWVQRLLHRGPGLGTKAATQLWVPRGLKADALPVT